MSATPPSGGKSWLKPVLALSVAANLFFLGVMGGNAFTGSKAETKRPTGDSYSFHPRVMKQILPEARHDDITEFRKQARKGLRGQWQNLNTLRLKVDATLRADPFDPEAYYAAQQAVIEAHGTMRLLSEEKIGAFIATLPREERIMLADETLRRLNERRDYWRKRREAREAAQKQ